MMNTTRLIPKGAIERMAGILFCPKTRLATNMYSPAKKKSAAKPHKRIFLPFENSSSDRL